MFQGDLGPALQREVAWLDSVPVEQLLQLSATPTGISSSALAYSCRLLPTSPHSQPHQKGAGKTTSGAHAELAICCLLTTQSGKNSVYRQ